jgi:hypothetical protein
MLGDATHATGECEATSAAVTRRPTDATLLGTYGFASGLELVVKPPLEQPLDARAAPGSSRSPAARGTARPGSDSTFAVLA